MFFVSSEHKGPALLSFANKDLSKHSGLEAGKLEASEQLPKLRATSHSR